MFRQPPQIDGSRVEAEHTPMPSPKDHPRMFANGTREASGERSHFQGTVFETAITLTGWGSAQLRQP